MTAASVRGSPRDRRLAACLNSLDIARSLLIIPSTSQSRTRSPIAPFELAIPLLITAGGQAYQASERRSLAPVGWLRPL